MEKLEKLFQGIENVHTETSGPEAIQPAITADIIVKLSQLTYGSSMNHNRNISSVAATLFGFMFALRASTIIAVRRCDVDLQPTKIVFKEIKRKSHQTQTTRVVELPIDVCQPAKALHKMLSIIFSTWKQPMQASLFSFNSDGTANTQVTEAINIALATIGVDSSHLGLTSHSLRRGAAVSMYSLGAPMQRILSWGAWKSQDSVQPYIKDRAWHAKSTSDQLCFAWMLH
jgi:integrase